LGLIELVSTKTAIKSDIAYGGYIGRAENLAMIRQLRIDLLHASRLDWSAYDATAIVDTQPGSRNHSFPRDQLPTIVIDHHPPREETEGCPFADVGGEYGATTTKLVEYLRAARVKIDERLGTALFCGVKSDTRDLGRGSNQADFDAYRYLIDVADLALVSDIEHPQVPREYFRAMVVGFRRARVFDSAAVVNLGEVYTPDLCAEMSDRLLQAEGIKWSLALGIHANQLYVSIRTRDKRRNAGKLISEVITERGMAGGHGSMAGARQPLVGQGTRARRATAQDVIRRFIKALDIPSDMKGEALYER
jgi:nanoRNase/pAp phosphatase (c-di-AMP/oligoRNAs hydrolase)